MRGKLALLLMWLFAIVLVAPSAFAIVPRAYQPLPCGGDAEAAEAESSAFGRGGGWSAPKGLSTDRGWASKYTYAPPVWLHKVVQFTKVVQQEERGYAYGAPESNYRPSRWHGFREEYRFTGKEPTIQEYRFLRRELRAAFLLTSRRTDRCTARCVAASEASRAAAAIASC